MFLSCVYRALLTNLHWKSAHCDRNGRRDTWAHTWSLLWYRFDLIVKDAFASHSTFNCNNLLNHEAKWPFEMLKIPGYMQIGFDPSQPVWYALADFDRYIFANALSPLLNFTNAFCRLADTTRVIVKCLNDWLILWCFQRYFSYIEKAILHFLYLYNHPTTKNIYSVPWTRKDLTPLYLVML